MENVFSLNLLKSPNDEELNVSRKRRSDAVEESPLPASPPPHGYPFLFSAHPSTSLRLDLNEHPPSNSVEVNSSARIRAQGPFQSYTSLFSEEDDQDSLPPCTREHVGGIYNIINQQGQQLTSMLANQQKNIYEKIVSLTEETMGKKLKEKTCELNKARLKILEMDTIVEHLKGQVEKVRSNNRQLEGKLEFYKQQLDSAMNSREKANASSYSAAQQQGVGESSQVDMNQGEMPLCKVCGKRLPTMILWPCHHLCLCKRCDTATKTCPCCSTTKQSSSVVLYK